MTDSRLALALLLVATSTQADDYNSYGYSNFYTQPKSIFSITQVYERSSAFPGTTGKEAFSDSLTRFQIETNVRYYFGVQSENNWYLSKYGNNQKVYYKLKAVTPYQTKLINLDSDDNIVTLAETRATTTAVKSNFSFFITLDGAKNGSTQFKAGTYTDKLTFCVGTDADDDDCDYRNDRDNNCYDRDKDCDRE